MREIKFRTWNPNGKKMNGLHGCIVLNDRIVRGLADSILMQYTGLKDKNGKEIYEGDIVRSTFNGIGKIEWDERNATYRSVGKTADMTLSVVTRESEIIGNIYENPELLKQ